MENLFFQLNKVNKRLQTSYELGKRKPLESAQLELDMLNVPADRQTQRIKFHKCKRYCKLRTPFSKFVEKKVIDSIIYFTCGCIFDNLHSYDENHIRLDMDRIYCQIRWENLLVHPLLGFVFSKIF